MSKDAFSLPDDAAVLRELVAQQAATIDEQRRELDQLKHYVAQLLKARFGPRTERLDPQQLALFAEPSVAPAAPAPPVETPVAAHVRRGGGRNALPEHLPRERIEHDLAEHDKSCPGCGRRRERIGCETSEQLEFVPAVLKVLEHVRWKYACCACQEHVATAPAPTKPLERGLPGPGLLAAIVVGKFSDHLPLYRLEDVFARSGVELGRSTLCRWARHAAELLESLYRRLAERVRASHVVHTDDTPVQVLDPALPKTRTGRFWVYDYTTSRKRDGPALFLKDYRGYLQADAFSGYDGIYAAGAVKQVLCWAHARRKFYEAKETQPSEAHAALAYVARLYDVEREAKPLAPEERLRLRRERSLPLLDEFRACLTQLRTDVLPKSPLGQAIGYVLPRWDGLVRYCEDPALAIDNNLSERTLRPCAIGRRNWTFLGNDRGGRTAAVLFSFTASCKANSVEPWAYLRDVVLRLAATRPSSSAELDELLPDAWLRTHPESRREYAR